MISMTIASCTDFSLDVPHRPSKPRHSEVNLCFLLSKLNHENIKRKEKEPPRFLSPIQSSWPEIWESLRWLLNLCSHSQWMNGQLWLILPSKFLIHTSLPPLHPFCHCLDPDSHHSSQDHCNSLIIALSELSQALPLYNFLLSVE